MPGTMVAIWLGRAILAAVLLGLSTLKWADPQGTVYSLQGMMALAEVALAVVLLTGRGAAQVALGLTVCLAGTWVGGDALAVVPRTGNCGCLGAAEASLQVRRLLASLVGLAALALWSAGAMLAPRTAGR